MTLTLLRAPMRVDHLGRLEAVLGGPVVDDDRLTGGERAAGLRGRSCRVANAEEVAEPSLGDDHEAVAFGLELGEQDVLDRERLRGGGRRPR